MPTEYIVFTSIVIIVTFTTLAIVYFFYRRSIAFTINLAIVGATAAAAISGFVFGKHGLSPLTFIISLLLISPAYLLVIMILKWIVDPIKEVSKAASGHPERSAELSTLVIHHRSSWRETKTQAAALLDAIRPLLLEGDGGKQANGTGRDLFEEVNRSLDYLSLDGMIEATNLL